MSLQWPIAAKKAIAKFFLKWNDVDVYIEDTAKHAKSLYKELVAPALPNKLKIGTVFPLGNRDSVIRACQNDQQKGGRPRIYLIDGDLDLLTGTPCAKLKRLYRHPVYAIENYLLPESAWIEILHEENPQFEFDVIKTRLNYQNLLGQLRPLIDLFICFGVTKALKPELKTISLGLGPFLSGGQNHWIDQQKVQNFINQRLTELQASSSRNRVRGVTRDIRARNASFSSPLDPIAARDFVFPLMRQYIKAQGLNLKVANDVLYMRLAKALGKDPDPRLIRALRTAISY